ncbi:uncharacterized protein LOC121879658, partial [Homarus americanus]|uniref:uncharacterized protein LOC121879658 n=1 Tax=Homarus americanus TaxID=6706 RepID=UPI001C477962
ILCEAGTTRVTLKSFLIAAGSLSFRGTSQLFRASNSIIPYLMQKDGSSRNKRLQSPVRSLVSSGLECPASAGLQNKKLKKNHIMDHKKDLFSAGVSANAPVSKSGNDSQGEEMLSPGISSTEG